jgi:hypothetical protein
MAWFFHACVGLAKIIYTRCIYGDIGREITKYTVIYGVYIRFWPTLRMCFSCVHNSPGQRAMRQLKTWLLVLSTRAQYTDTHISSAPSSQNVQNTHTRTKHTHTHTHTRALTITRSTLHRPRTGVGLGQTSCSPHRAGGSSSAAC